MPRAAVTEAFTWIGTALGLGVAVGASVAGKIVDVAGRQRAFLVATVAAALAAVVVAAVPAAAARARRARRGAGARSRHAAARQSLLSRSDLTGLVFGWLSDRHARRARASTAGPRWTCCASPARSVRVAELADPDTSGRARARPSLRRRACPCTATLLLGPRSPAPVSPNLARRLRQCRARRRPSPSAPTSGGRSSSYRERRRWTGLLEPAPGRRRRSTPRCTPISPTPRSGCCPGCPGRARRCTTTAPRPARSASCRARSPSGSSPAAAHRACTRHRRLHRRPGALLRPALRAPGDATSAPSRRSACTSTRRAWRWMNTYRIETPAWSAPAPSGRGWTGERADAARPQGARIDRRPARRGALADRAGHPARGRRPRRRRCAAGRHPARGPARAGGRGARRAGHRAQRPGVALRPGQRRAGCPRPPATTSR